MANNHVRARAIIAMRDCIPRLIYDKLADSMGRVNLSDADKGRGK